MAAVLIMNKMSSAPPSLWDKNQSIRSSLDDDEGILFESESVASAMKFLDKQEKEESEVSLHENDFAILRAADPQVAEKFQTSVGNLYRSKSPGTVASRKIQSVELIAQFSKSLPHLSSEDLVLDKVEKSSSTRAAKSSLFDSPTFVKPSFAPATIKEDSVFASPRYRTTETSFYGSKQDVFASPGSIHDDSSSCTSSKDDLIFCSPKPGPKTKEKNLVRNVGTRPSPTAAPKRAGQTTKRAAVVEPTLMKKKPVVVVTENPEGRPVSLEKKRAKSVSPVRLRVSSTAATTKTAKPKSRSSSLKRGTQETTVPTLSNKQEQLLKEKLLRSLSADQGEISGSQSVSAILLPTTDVDGIVGNIRHCNKSPATTGGGRRKTTKSSDLLNKLQKDKAVSLPFSASRCDGTTTVTTSTSTKSTNSKSKSPSKHKRVIKIRKSDLDASEQPEKKANLDDLLDKAASEWKATLRRSSMSSGTNWQKSSISHSDERVSTSQAPLSVAGQTEKKRQPSRSRREKRVVADEKVMDHVDKRRPAEHSRREERDSEDIEINKDVKSAPNKGEQNRDSSRSRRRSPRSYELLRASDDNASKDQSTDGNKNRNRSKSRRSSRKILKQPPSPERRKSILNELKVLASPARKGERSTRSTRTSEGIRRPSLMASVAKKFGSERKERSNSTPRAFRPSPLETERMASRRSLSNPRSLRTASTSISEDSKRESTSGPFSLQGLQKMLGFSSPTDKKEKLLKMAKESISDQPLLLSDPILEYPRSESSSTKSTLLARIRQAGVTDAILLALSEQGLVIVERKSA